MRNWAATGHDQVYPFWVKHFTSLHTRLAYQFQDIIKSDIILWMTTGRAVLLQKSSDKGAAASNFRPITCLPSLLNLSSSIIADQLYRHLLSQGEVLGMEQKGCRRGYRGAIDQLLIDNMILRKSKTRHKNLEMLWVDYKKSL